MVPCAYLRRKIEEERAFGALSEREEKKGVYY